MLRRQHRVPSALAGVVLAGGNSGADHDSVHSQAGVRFAYAYRDEEAGGGGKGGDGPDGGGKAVSVGEHSDEEGVDGEAAVAPQAVDADGACAPC